MSIMESGLVFIGAGNMAEALVSGIITGGFRAPNEIVMTDIRSERLIELKTKYGIMTSTNNRIVDHAGIVVLAVKPQIIKTVLSDIASVLPKETFVISIAAGISTATIEATLDADYRVVRVMPNTPALIGRGASAIAGGINATEADLEIAKAMLDCVGITVRVDEKEMDAITALSGSGPAYVFYLLEGMLEAAKTMGLKEGIARRLALQTVEGAARLMMNSGETPTTLRENITSKGGTTAAAISSLDEAGVKRAVVQAVLVAQKQSIELSRN